MSYTSYTEKLKYLIWLIEKKSGDAKALSLKLDVSVRTLKRMIAYFKDQGHNIQCSKSLKYYKIIK